MKDRGNVGITGVASIRLGDMKISDLPIAEGAIAKQQMPLAEDTERQNEIQNILAGYPKHSVVYLDSRVREAEENIIRINQMKSQQSAMISEYTSQISLCKFRDEEIERITEDDEERDTKIKDLFKRFPPYKVPAMEQQVIQSNEAIERADDVIAKEYTSIAELREIKGLCVQRDIKLRYLGAAVVG